MRSEIASLHRRATRFVAPLSFVALCAIAALSIGSSAIAEDVVRSLGGPTTTFSTASDPHAFIDELAVVMPKPMVPLTREDAVAIELAGRSESLSQIEAVRTAHALCEESDRLGHDPLIFLAVIHVESNYNHLAISPVGAEGLMQLMPYTAEWFAVAQGLAWDDSHSFDPELNVRLGARYLAMLHRQFRGRMDLALTAYNRGPNATRYLVNRHGSLPQDIRDFYAAKVLERYYALRSTYGHLS